MDELLREAACLGNLDAVQKLLEKGASINSQHSINGWTALHWACKRGHVTIVEHLLRRGADVNPLSVKSESVADVTSDENILRLLEARSVQKSSSSAPSEEDPSPIVPNYLQYPPFPYYDVQKSLEKIPNTSIPVPITSRCTELADSSTEVLSGEMNGLHIQRPEQNKDCGTSGTSSPSSSSSLQVKVRVCGSGECDFVEVEVGALTYPALVAACCEELELTTTDVAKIRKLPNVLVRKDRDVQRMKDGQELEVVLKTHHPSTNT